MFINPKDAPFAVAMAVLLLGLVRLLEEYPKPSAADASSSSASGFGLSIGSRIMAGFGVIYALVRRSACSSLIEARAPTGCARRVARSAGFCSR